MRSLGSNYGKTKINVVIILAIVLVCFIYLFFVLFWVAVFS